VSALISSARNPLWSGHERRFDLYVSNDAEHVARLVYVFGLMPNVPRGPAAMGAGAPIPDRRRENGVWIPASGTRREGSRVR
jgi:hypothetical protein